MDEDHSNGKHIEAQCIAPLHQTI